MEKRNGRDEIKKEKRKKYFKYNIKCHKSWNEKKYVITEVRKSEIKSKLEIELKINEYHNRNTVTNANIKTF